MIGGIFAFRLGLGRVWARHSPVAIRVINRTAHTTRKCGCAHLVVVCAGSVGNLFDAHLCVALPADQDDRVARLYFGTVLLGRPQSDQDLLHADTPQYRTTCPTNQHTTVVMGPSAIAVTISSRHQSIIPGALDRVCVAIPHVVPLGQMLHLRDLGVP